MSLAHASGPCFIRDDGQPASKRSTPEIEISMSKRVSLLMVAWDSRCSAMRCRCMRYLCSPRSQMVTATVPAEATVTYLYLQTSHWDLLDGFSPVCLHLFRQWTCTHFADPRQRQGLMNRSESSTGCRHILQLSGVASSMTRHARRGRF